MAKAEHLSHKKTTIITQYACVFFILCSVFSISATIYNYSKICTLENEINLLQIFMTNVKNDFHKSRNLQANIAELSHKPENKILVSDVHSKEIRFKRKAPTSKDEVHSTQEYKHISQLKLYDLLETTQREGLQNESNYRSSSDVTPPIFTRTSRVMFADGKTRVTKQATKKPILKSLDLKTHQDNQSFEVPEPHRPRHRQKHRQKMVETFDEQQFTVIRPTRKHIPAAHFSGDSSKYIQGQDLNFNGNGHMRHLSKTYVDWKPSDWVESLHMEQYFNMENGVLTIKEPGLYLVYAQICYLDKHDLNGYMVYKNGHSILQCTTMTHSREPVMKSNTCYTAGVEHFSEGDKLRIQDLSDGRYSLFEREKSFFGAVKLSDTRNK